MTVLAGHLTARKQAGRDRDVFCIAELKRSGLALGASHQVLEADEKCEAEIRGLGV